MPHTSDTDRAEILNTLDAQHDQLLAQLTELDQRIEAALSAARGDKPAAD